MIFGLFSKDATYQSQLIVFDIDLSGFCRSWNVLWWYEKNETYLKIRLFFHYN